MTSLLVDSHCHLDRLDLKGFDNQLQGALDHAREHGVKHMLCVAINLEAYPEMLALVEAYPDIFASVGVHPNETDGKDPDADELVKLATHPKVIAIGETGLDYFRSNGDLEWQRVRFRNHIEAAKKVNLPLIIHMRDAKEDTLKILAEEGAEQCGGVMHCFAEDWETAQQALALGFYISLSGIVTFKNALALQEVAQKVPLDRLLIETDSPYLAPVPFRGKSNQPAYVRYVAEKIAALRGIALDEVANRTTENFFQLFQAKT
ncbi:MAG: TatD family hydrolase [Gammaproteobacteria bacterium]|nr:TatD family hydrolase [Gammaproteobacteria bacterium]